MLTLLLSPIFATTHEASTSVDCPKAFNPELPSHWIAGAMRAWPSLQGGRRLRGFPEGRLRWIVSTFPFWDSFLGLKGSY